MSEHSINAKTLAQAGYLRSPPSTKGEWCTDLYSKTIMDKLGNKAYFIRFHLWSFPEKVMPDPAVRTRYSVDVEVTLYKEGGTHFEVDLALNPTDTIDKVEAFYADTYIRMGCCPDLDNN